MDTLLSHKIQIYRQLPWLISSHIASNAFTLLTANNAVYITSIVMIVFIQMEFSLNVQMNSFVAL